LESQFSQLFVSQVQAMALVSDLSESLNESNYYFIVPLLEPGQSVIFSSLMPEKK
jgi:hypothetical protein